MKVSDNSLMYVRLGWNRSNLQYRESSTVNGNTIATSKSNATNGWGYGLGMETSVAPNMSLRGEFDHVNLNSFNTSNGTKVDPSDNQFKLSLVWHFA